MLRWFTLALVLANLLVWAYGQGWLATIGLAPTSERDGARLAQQVRPEAVRVLSSAEAAAALQRARGAANVALVCLESGAIAAASIDAAEQALAAVLPERGWIRSSREIPAQYAVVIGPLPRDALPKKREELQRLRVAFEEFKLPGEREGGPALSLGPLHESREAAQTALDGLAQRGVRAARVMPLREAVSEQRLRIENATPEQAEALRGVKAAALGPEGMQPCAAAQGK